MSKEILHETKALHLGSVIQMQMLGKAFQGALKERGRMTTGQRGTSLLPPTLSPLSLTHTPPPCYPLTPWFQTLCSTDLTVSWCLLSWCSVLASGSLQELSSHPEWFAVWPLPFAPWTLATPWVKFLHGPYCEWGSVNDDNDGDAIHFTHQKES